jgi:hypothetical protein
MLGVEIWGWVSEDRDHFTMRSEKKQFRKEGKT